jgi:hypothetical protein
MNLYQQWLEAKENERLAVERRREIEDQLALDLKINPNQDKSQTFDADGYRVKITTRLTRKIDADRLQEIAAENGLTAHLSNLFRWKPEIVAAAWKAAADNITRPLLGAIETKPGRPSFNIEEVK